MPKKPIQSAIFIGRGLTKDAPACFMNWGFVNLDKDGNYVDVSSLPPDYDLGSLKLGGVALYVGKQNILPTWDDADNFLKLRKAVASENFAHPNMQDQLDQWLSQGIEGEALHDVVKEAGGLITLKDFGLDPIEEAPAQKGG